MHRFILSPHSASRGATRAGFFRGSTPSLSTLSSTDFDSDACAAVGLDALGIFGPQTIHRNLSYDELRAHEMKNKEGVVTNHYGCFAVDTGVFTGRSPKDKYIVRRPGSNSSTNVWWGDVNQPIHPQVFEDVLQVALNHYNTSVDECYVFDGFVGASAKSSRRVRFVHERAWQQHFVTNMFIRPTEDQLKYNFDDRDFTVINACAATNERWREHGLNSEVCVAMDVERKLAVILGTWYGGENKKGLFSMMNYWLPMEDKLPMHCSASVAKKDETTSDSKSSKGGGNTALFFGLSGTGKTSLSTDPNRSLIGDDEHGWDEDGIFNFEGGCYAKTIDLSAEKEPDIFGAIKAPAGLLENVMVDGLTGVPDYSDTSKTANGRVSYPIYHIENHEPSGTSLGDHPEHILFLTCDAFGVLPPIAKLTTEQAMYHFITGYTAKVAGTERGVTEPEATFSACFGAAFLTLHPLRYADLLREKLERHGSAVYLVNTGWSAGGAGGEVRGERMPIAATRACVNAVLDGSIANLSKAAATHQANSPGAECPYFETDPIFGFQIPKSLSLPTAESSTTKDGVHVPLLPRDAWSDRTAYDATRLKLADMFINNFKKFSDGEASSLADYGPQLHVK